MKGRQAHSRAEVGALNRIVPLVLLALVVVMAGVPAAEATHEGSKELLDRWYEWSGTLDAREYFQVDINDTYEYVCYLRSYYPTGAWTWEAELRGDHGKLVATDVGVEGTHPYEGWAPSGVHGGVALPTAVPFDYYDVYTRGYEGTWSLDVHGAGDTGSGSSSGVHVEVYLVQTVEDCGFHD